ncbi:MAG TPA: cytochrome c3 family protein [Candidatus Dormibacteraeota bacterium]|nr:cytochrome c3 family protein [Candidatus Dormibacteraeota bacterium]
MSQIFHRSTNTLSRVSIYAAVFVLAGLTWVLMALDRSPYTTKQGIVLRQPVPFSHEHHVAGLGLDCRYCHTSVETSSFAGMPPTATCMNCHKLIWADSDMLEPVRASLRDDRPIVWTRVHDLPDFAYFDHSIHVAKGIGCVSCHGRVDQMPLMRQAAPLQMEWCLECHRHPEAHVRPRSEVFNLNWAAADQASLGPRLVKEYGIRSVRDLTSCSTCHR